jgi:hypothetical protein
VPKFPGPPFRGQLVARLPPDVKALSPGTIVWRIYFRSGTHPITWNRFRHWGPVATARFDHHSIPARPQARGTVYGALRVYTCFAEVFQDTRTIERSRKRPWLVGFELIRPVSLLDLTGTWSTKAGASMAISSGRRDRARAWSVRIYEDYPTIEGLYYPSSMDSNQPSIALYERAHDALPTRPLFHRALADPALTGAVVRAALLFNYGVEP